jgi:hypothetical protein
MGRSFQRKRLLVNVRFQGRLLVRLTAYLFVFIAVVWHVGFFCQLVPNFGAGDGMKEGVLRFYLDFMAHQKHFLLALLLVLPCLLYDLLEFSNRIAGPLYRCQRVLTEMAAGRPVPPFVPRKGDHMKEFFEAFNAAIKAWNEHLAAAGNGQPADAAGGAPEAQHVNS